MDDLTYDDLTLQHGRLPPGEGYDDGVPTLGDLTKPKGGYPCSDEEDHDQQLAVYNGEGGDDVKVYERHLEHQQETGVDPPPSRRRGLRGLR